MRAARAVLASAILAVSGCSREAPVQVPDLARDSQASSENRPVAWRPSAPSSIETEFLELAKDEPRFAGVFLDPDGAPVVVMRDGGVSDANRAAILARVAQRSGAFSSFTPSRVVASKYSFDQLNGFRERVREAVRNLTVVPVSVGIDVEKNRLVLRTTQARHATADVALAAVGVPRDAYELTVDSVEATVSLRGVIRPVTGGVQISYLNSTLDYCSAGLQAWKNDVNGNPDVTQGRFITTANHCAPPTGTVTGLTFGQPHRGYGLHATEVANAELFYDARCPYGGSGCQYADVAVLKMEDSVTSTWQRVAVSNTSNPPTYLGQLSLNTSIWSAVQGQPIRRVGATSGQRNGTVAISCTDLLQGGTYILCSVEVNGYSDGGDSGGPVYTPLTALYPGSPWRSGILHSGNIKKTKYWFSPLDYVLFSLGGAYTM